MPGVKQQNAAYGQALEEGAKGFRQTEAIKLGQTFDKMRAEDLAEAFATYSDVEKQAFRIGAVDRMVSRMEADRALEPNFTKYFQGEGMRQKLDMIMPSPELAKKWSERLATEQKLSRNANQARANSVTARREMAKEDALEMDGVNLGSTVEFLTDAASGNPNILRRIGDFLTGKALDKQASAFEQTNIGLAEILKAKTPEEFNRLMKLGMASRPVAGAYSPVPPKLRGGGAQVGASFGAPPEPQPALPF